MPIEFDNVSQYAIAVVGKTLSSNSGVYQRWSEVVMAALRSAGIFSTMVDGPVTPGDQSVLWFDTSTDPGVLKYYSSIKVQWDAVTADWFVGQFTFSSLPAPSGTGDALVVNGVASFEDNHLYQITPTQTNTGAAMTIQMAGYGTYSVTYMDGSNLAASEFSAGVPITLLFSEGSFKLLWPAADASAAAASANAAALYDGPTIDSLTALEADSAFTYTAAQPGTVVAGDIIRTLQEDLRYEVAASGATDHHTATTGGVKVYEAGSRFTTLQRFIDALSRGDTYPANAIVNAGQYKLRKRSGATITGASGWAFEENVGNRLPVEAYTGEAVQRYNLRADRTTGNHNVLQNFAIDHVNRHVYTVQVTGSGPENVYMNRFDMDGPFDQTSIDYQNNTTELRHQSLAIEYLKNGAVKFWSSSEVDRHLLTRFDYTAFGAPANIEYYQVGDDGADERIWNVQISPDQRLLVVQTGTLYRVYDFQAMLAGGAGDYSGSALYEFTIGAGSQGYAFDGKYIYVTSGTVLISSADNNINVYNIYGEEVLEILAMTMGDADAALEGGGTDNEPEGCVVVRERADAPLTLAFGRAQGDAGYYPGRVNKLYMPPVVSPIVEEQDEAETVIAGLTGTLSVAHRKAIHQMVGRLKTGGVWTKLGALYVMASDVDANGLVDWIQPGTNDLVKTGTPAFVAFGGFTGDGSTTLLKSTLDVTSLTEFAAADSHVGFFNTAGAAGGTFTDASIGVSTGDYLFRARSIGDKLNVRSGNVTTESPSGNVNVTAVGCCVFSRDSGSTVNCTFDGRDIYGGPVTQTETFNPTGKFTLLGRDFGGPFECTSRTMGVASIGAALTRQEVSVYRNSIVEYLENAPG